MSLIRINTAKNKMDHDSSDYKASIVLTYQQMWEVSKAIYARIADWVEAGVLSEKDLEINWLTQVLQILEPHISYAVDQWENELVDKEILDLDQAINKMLEEDGSDS